MEDAAELADLIASYPDVDTHLVLPAFMRQSDMSRIIHRYSVFQPKKLLFTHVDETGHYGPLVSQAASCRFPFPSWASGRRFPTILNQPSIPGWRN